VLALLVAAKRIASGLQVNGRVLHIAFGGFELRFPHLADAVQ
jgi:hypothetical protein